MSSHFDSHIALALVFCLCLPSNEAFAQLADGDVPSASSKNSLVPNTAFFVGAGAGYGNTTVTGQSLWGFGNSNVYVNGTPLQVGAASGTGYYSMPSSSTFVPSVQLGYFKHFENSNWLWGGKFSYNYVGATSSVQPALVPQAGAYSPGTTGGGTTTPFTGNFVINSYQITITNQFLLAPMIGRSFDKGFIYTGAGPSLSNITTSINGSVGTANLGGNPWQNVSGAPQSFSNYSWVFGGAIMAGGTYFFSPTWFLDLSYTFGIAGNNYASFVSPYVNPNAGGGVSGYGSTILNSNGYVITNAVMLTINKKF